MGGLHLGKSGKCVEDRKTGVSTRGPALFRIDGSDVELEEYEVLVLNKLEPAKLKDKATKHDEAAHEKRESVSR
ncbi:hypothetical protein RhiTH_011712 [Rhizoctonia solani]